MLIAYMLAISDITSLTSLALQITGSRNYVVVGGRNYDITDEGIVHLEKLVHLKSLDISGCCAISSRGFHALSKLPIEDLRADNAYIREDGLEAITKFTKLKILSIQGSVGLKDISTKSGLKHLSVLSSVLSHEIHLISNIYVSPEDFNKFRLLVATNYVWR